MNHPEILTSFIFCFISYMQCLAHYILHGWLRDRWMMIFYKVFSWTFVLGFVITGSYCIITCSSALQSPTHSYTIRNYELIFLVFSHFTYSILHYCHFTYKNFTYVVRVYTHYILLIIKRHMIIMSLANWIFPQIYQIIYELYRI